MKSLSGASGTIVTSPLEFLKTRLQVGGFVKIINSVILSIYIVNDWPAVHNWRR